MRRSIVIALASSAVLTCAVAYRVAASPAGEEPTPTTMFQGKPRVAPRGPSSFSVGIEIIGSNKTLSFDATTSSQSYFHLMTAAQEIDVTSITIENGLFTGPTAAAGGFTIATVGGVDHYFATNTYGTTSYVYPTPLLLREGTTITWDAATGSNNAYAQIVLHGTDPNVRGASGLAAR